jgi:YidC/Oxa1 family membrane protein insertase
MYFQRQHEETLRVWNEQQKLKQEQQQKAVEEKQLSTLPVEEKAEAVTPESKKEQFYVLENAYQQLVFSNHGAALAEINLPFQNAKNKVSVVKETEFDRNMMLKNPQNARFPSHPYYTPGTTEKELTLNPEGNLGGYYPLIRRDLLEVPPYQDVRVGPKFYALNITSEYPELAELVYTVTKFTKNTIVFEAKQAHRKITKTYQIADETTGGPYTLDLSVQIDGDSRGLWLTSGVPEIEWISGGSAPALKYRITRNNKPAVEAIDLPQDTTTVSSLNPDWICNSNGFFGLILDPLTEAGAGFRSTFVSGTQVPSRLVEIDQQYDLYPAEKMPGYQVMVPFKSAPGTTKFRIFAGPFSSEILKQVDATYSDTATNYNPDYIACQTFHGWFSFISEPFAKVLFWLMQGFYFLTGSWGFSIILLTVALRIMLYPLNAWSIKSTAKMQQIAPEVKAIQDKYKKDPQKSQVEIVNLYRERGVNPVSGCLPMLIQMPFLIGMFDLLKSTFELRGASFIPGWINDLSAPDVLFSWNYPIFFIGNDFHLLPFLLGGVMFLQQRMMTPTPANPNDLSDAQRQQKAMGSMMTVMFTLMFYHFPSGLNIYWLSSMLLGIAQQWWTTRQMQSKPAIIKK